MRKLVLLSFALLTSVFTFGQISGTYTIPGATYTTIASAIAALNTSGVGSGGVTFNVTAGYTETFASPTAGYFTISSNLPTASNQVIFQKSGSGADPLITAGVGTGTFDAIIAFSGISYVTFNGIDLQESAANVTAVTQMEYGYALLKASGTQGSQNITIKNCTITLNKTNANGTYGIYSNNGTTAAPTTALTVTAVSGTNSNEKFYGNTITNMTYGIYLYGFADGVVPYAFYDQNNDIGSVTGNTFTNFGGGTISPYCVYVYYQNGLNIANCNINGGTGTAATTSIYGIYGGTATNANVNIYGNTITITHSLGTSGYIYGIYNSGMGTGGTTNTLNIYNNIVQNCTEPNATTAYFYGIYNASSAFNTNVYGNTVTNNVIAGSYYMYFCYTNSGTGGVGNVYNNTLTYNQRSGAGTQSSSAYLYMLYIAGSTSYSIHDNTVAYNTAPAQVTYGAYFYCLYASNSAASQNIYNNSIHDNSITSSYTSSHGMYGIYSYPSSSSSGSVYNNNVYNQTINSNSTGYGYLYGIVSYYGLSMYSNNVYNLTINGSLTGYGYMYGLYSYYQVNTYSNNVYNLAINNSGTGYGYGYGYYIGSTNGTNVYKNQLYNVSMAGASGYYYGMYVGSGTTNNLYNNYVSDLRAPASTSGTAITGVYLAGGTNDNMYFNTVYLNASSTSSTTFGTNAVYVSTGVNCELRNNIFINRSTAPSSTTYITAAYKRTSTTLTSYVSTSNNNLFYAGTPSATNLIYTDGTNNLQTLAAYKNLVSPMDAQAVTELPPFINIATTPYNLRMQTTVATQCESGGSVVSTPVNITTDYDGTPRYPNTGYPNNAGYSATAPDIGANEFGGLLLDLTPPAMNFTPLSNTSSLLPQTLTTIITDQTGVPTSGIGLPVCYWKKNWVGTWTSAQAVYVSGHTYTFTFGSGVALGDSIYYYLVSQDLVTPIPNIGANPSTGAAGYTYNPPAVSTRPTTLYAYKIVPNICGTYNVGVGQTFTSITAAVAALNADYMTCPVTLVLTDASYGASETFPIVLGNVAGSSATNTITIKPAAGVTPTISGSSTSGIFVLYGTQYLTINGSNSGGTDKSLTFTQTNTVSGTYCLGIFNNGSVGASNCVIKNCNFLASTQVSNTTYAFIFNAAGGGYTNDIVQNNNIYSAYEGMQLAGISGFPAENCQIIGNTIGSTIDATALDKYGIFMAQADNCLVSGNEIMGGPSGNTNYSQVGLYMSTGSTNNMIRSNKIHDWFYVTLTGGWGNFGIYYVGDALTVNEISNNVIYNIKADSYTSGVSVDNLYGVYIGSGGNLKFYHNSINLQGSFTSSTYSNATACVGIVSGITLLDFENNIFKNSLLPGSGSPTSYTYDIQCAGTAATFSNLNYNDYWDDGNGPNIGYLNGVQYPTLASWKTATGMEVNGINVNPLFSSATYLLPTTALMNNAGTYLPLVPMDIVGTIRSNPPDMGAYEFATDPLVNTTAASGITGVGATLNGTINASNFTVNSFFDYGLTTAYGTSVAGVPASVTGNTVTGISVVIGGLSPSTLYHYRARGVTTTALTAYGPDLTFTTSAIPATVVTNAATAVTATTATLNGTVNANNSSTTVTFNYGLTTAYGTTVPGVPSTVTGSSVTTVTAAITGLAPGTLYHFRVSGVNAGGTANGGDLTFTTSPPPAVVTTAATGIAATAATLNGTINANNSSTTVTFDYGLTLAYGTTVPGVPSPVNGSIVTPVSAAISGLLPGTLYHYRVNGTYSGGTVNGGDMTFTTPALAPTVVTNAATGITQTGATLNGTVTANGASTAVTFNYGLTVAYGSTVPGIPSPVTGNTATAVSATLTGLIINTTYHYQVCGVNSVGSTCGNDMTFTTVCPAAGPAGPIIGPASVCQGGSGYVYTVTILNATGYVWTLPIGGTITSGNNTNTITVSYAYNAVPGYIMVYGTAPCGNGAPSQLLINMNAPANPTIAGPASVCINSMGNVYTTQAGMTNYIWTVTGGTITAGGGLANNTVTVTWTSAGAKTVCVNYTNANGCAGLAPYCYNVTVNPLPVPTISGPSPACSNVPGLVYSTQTGMTTYLWSISAGGSITGGIGTSAVTVTWSTPGAQTLSVNYTNGNGCTAVAPTVYPVTVNSTVTPTITGSTNLCVNSGYYTYTTQPGMTNYLWNISSGGVINYGSGTNAITVTWVTPGAQWVSVNFTNPSGCSSPNPTTLNVTVNPLPGPAGSITGTATVCGGTNGVAYSVAPITGATAYVWALPAGATIASGGNTNAITVNFAGNASSGVIIVTGNNTCGDGQASPPFAVTVNPLPDPAGTITGPASVCQGATGKVYTVPAINNATGYAWTTPAGATITSGANTNTITVDFSNSAASGNITVAGTNSCGNGTVSPNFAVTLNPVPVTPVVTNHGDTLHSSAPTGNQWYDMSGIITGATGQTYVATVNSYYWVVVTLNGCSSAESNHLQIITTGIDSHSSASINVYPVPNDGRFTASITTVSDQTFSIRVFNNLGVKIFEETKVEVNGTIQKVIDLRPVPDGVYSVIFENSLNQVVKKIIVNK